MIYQIAISTAIVIFGILFSSRLTLALQHKKPAFVGFFAAETEKNREVNSVRKLLYFFAFVVILIGIISTITWWKEIIQNRNNILISSWLFLAMVLGMLVEVVTENRKSGKPLLNVTLSQILYPLLFSIVVFYPIWLSSINSNNRFFGIYTAFLNGYYWKNTVASSKPRRNNTKPKIK
jgi:hypothetical protein